MGEGSGKARENCRNARCVVIIGSIDNNVGRSSFLLEDIERIKVSKGDGDFGIDALDLVCRGLVAYEGGVFKVWISIDKSMENSASNISRTTSTMRDNIVS